jgi:hypothetical protein
LAVTQLFRFYWEEYKNRRPEYVSRLEEDCHIYAKGNHNGSCDAGNWGSQQHEQREDGSILMLGLALLTSCTKGQLEDTSIPVFLTLKNGLKKESAFIPCNKPQTRKQRGLLRRVL